MKACIYSLGCKVNQYEGQAIADGLRERGVKAFTELCAADVYVLNTCSVTAEADRKSRQLVARALKFNPQAKVYIIGCSSQNNPGQYAKKHNVSYIGGSADKNAVISHIMSDVNNDAPLFNICELPREYEDMRVFNHSRTRAYIKIQDGCNNFCSYCIVPYLRGRSRSRGIGEIVSEVEIALATTKEIVLTGVDISSYGKDEGTDLKALLSELGKFDCRKRLGSLECGVIDEALLKCMVDNGYCGHFHLSLQSGSDSVLKRMNRHYTTLEYEKKVDLIRKFYPDAGITTDIICGFPGETQSEHNETVKFVSGIGFSDIHVFPYSERSGTKAALMKQTPKSERERRAAELTEVKRELHKKFLSAFTGRIMEVYYEKRDGNFTHGYTENYMKVYSYSGTAGLIQNTLLTNVCKDGIKGDVL